MVELGEFVKHYDELKAIDVQLLAVSADTLDQSRTTQEELKIPFPVLADFKYEVMEVYGTREVTGSMHDLQGHPNHTPTLVLVDKTGTVRWIRRAADFKVVAPVTEVVAEALAEAAKLK
ncbi:MAG: redoxin domain-containing protein [Candidatus Acidiferrales bacterium]|jgi:peroxiredoxin